MNTPLDSQLDIAEWLSSELCSELYNSAQHVPKNQIPNGDIASGLLDTAVSPEPSNFILIESRSTGHEPTLISECISSFQQHCLPRLPLLHTSTIERDDLPVNLTYSMAALGALHISKYKRSANELHEWSIRETEAVKSTNVCSSNCTFEKSFAKKLSAIFASYRTKYS